jgi:DNA-binding MarR family transcriptional regulator
MIVIGHAAGLSVDRLGKVLRLSHPGTVRVVDRLVAAGFAERKTAAADRRALALHLTPAGETERAAMLDSRRGVINPILGHLTPEELPILERLLEKMLVTLPCDATTAMTVCRFCDHSQCRNCPMDQFDAAGDAGCATATPLKQIKTP